MKTALITGASSGIGEAIARILAERDYNLIICGRREERLIDLQAELSTKIKVDYLVFDVRDRDKVKEVLEPVVSERVIDVLINNAGNAHGLAPIDQGDLDDWDAMIDGNVKGLMDGSHTIERCYDVTSRALHRLFGALCKQRVPLEQILLKPNMVISGKECATRAGKEQIAELTLRCFDNHVPAAVPGIVFLSGGQSDVEATVNLNQMNQRKNLPWEVSFSYGRALQAPPLAAWRGKVENVAAAQAAFAHRSLCNGKARYGEYSPEMEQQA